MPVIPLRFFPKKDLWVFPVVLALGLMAGMVRAGEALVVPTDPNGFELPVYRGIDQVLVLSDRWLVVAVTTLPEVIRCIDGWTDGAYTKAIQRWEASQVSGGKPDWSAWKNIGELRSQWYARARDAVGELELARPSSFKIRRVDDQDRLLAQPQHAYPAWVGLDGDRYHPGSTKTYYAVYTYLELAEPLVPGGTYRIEGPQGQSAVLHYDLDRTVARTIKINQVGYRPNDGAKLGYLGGWIPGRGPLDLAQATVFDLVDADSGAVVLKGRPLVLRDDASPCLGEQKNSTKARPAITGERLYDLDFSDITRPGRYYLRVPGVGRSWPFRIAEDVYAAAFYTAMRGLFHQRGSFALEPPYTAWSRPRLHTDPVYESSHVPFAFGVLTAPKGYERFDVVGASRDLSRPHTDVIGGWYDAADYDRNIAHYTVIFDLLWLFELRPGVFTDGQLHLPESGNGIPDLLDEVEFGLRVWLRSMDERGAVAGAVETSTHPSYDDSRYPFAFSLRTCFASLHFSAAAAQFSRVVRPYSPALAERYATAAQRAWDFGSKKENLVGPLRIPARKNRGLGDSYDIPWQETEDLVRPFLLLARTQMAMLTGNDDFLKGIEGDVPKLPKPYLWPYTTKDYSPWLYYALVGPLAKNFPGLSMQLRSWYLPEAERLAQLALSMPYRHSWPRDRDSLMSWGATLPTNANRALLIAESLEPNADRRTAILTNAAASFGANPLGMSWTTGVGFCYPAVIQHEWSERDHIADPVPGMTIYGITEGMSQDLRQDIWSQQGKNADGQMQKWTFWEPGEIPVWRRWSPHPTLNTPQCEFTVHETCSSTIFTCGMLMAAGWMPDQTLTNRTPRPLSQLYGYWPLP